MVNIAFVVHRKWGYDIFRNLVRYQKIRQDFRIRLLILSKNNECRINLKYLKKNSILHYLTNDKVRIHSLLEKNKIDIVCFYSWSQIVDNKTVRDFTCLCLHPSLLPNYRGGTPIQNQILNNEKNTGITIFRMNNDIDGGPIYSQEPISFIGNVQDIIKRMTDVGTLMTKQLITDAVNGNLQFNVQKNANKYPIYKRRVPKQSEIKFDQLQNMKFIDFNNLARGLNDPYPNAFIRMPKNKTIKILNPEYYKVLPENANILNTNSKTFKKGLFLKLADGFAKI